MITNLYPSSQWVEAQSNPLIPYVSSSANPMQGVVRCVNNRYEIWDGTTWVVTGSAASIDLSPLAKQVMDWAHNKMLEERFIKDLATKNAAVADALSAVEQAEEQLKVVLALTQENT